MNAARARRHAGLSLLEVLLAGALASLVVVAAAVVLAGSRGAVDSAGAASDELAALDLGRDLLAGQLRRSGYRPLAGSAAPALDPTRAPLVVTLAGGADGPDALRVRYVDDTLASGPVVRDLRFDVAVDGRGLPQLYRAVAAGVRQPLVEGIAGLRVDGWVDATGAHDRAALRARSSFEPWLLLVTLSTPSGRQRRLVAPLPARPEAEVAAPP